MNLLVLNSIQSSSKLEGLVTSEMSHTQTKEYMFFYEQLLQMLLL